MIQFARLTNELYVYVFSDSDAESITFIILSNIVKKLNKGVQALKWGFQIGVPQSILIMVTKSPRNPKKHTGKC